MTTSVLACYYPRANEYYKRVRQEHLDMVEIGSFIKSVNLAITITDNLLIILFVQVQK